MGRYSLKPKEREEKNRAYALKIIIEGFYAITVDKENAEKNKLE